jgi:hypothetical protein
MLIMLCIYQMVGRRASSWATLCVSTRWVFAGGARAVDVAEAGREASGGVADVGATKRYCLEGAICHEGEASPKRIREVRSALRSMRSFSTMMYLSCTRNIAASRCAPIMWYVPRPKCIFCDVYHECRGTATFVIHVTSYGYYSPSLRAYSKLRTTMRANYHRGQ